MKTKEFQALAPILIVEDNADDAFLTRRAFTEARVENPTVLVNSGVEAVDYLLGRGHFSNREEYPLPCFILLDLKMPTMNGFALLGWIKDHPRFRRIPTVVFTTSMRDEDAKQAYELGAHSFVTKPVDYKMLVKLARSGHTYWTRVYQSFSRPS